MLLLRKFRISSFWLSLILIMFSGHALLYGGQQEPGNTIDTTLTWINQIRGQEGLETLSTDPKLNRVAQTHSEKMAEYNILSDSDPVLGTPVERIKSSGLTDANNLVIVARAKNLELLQQQIMSPENLSKILSPEMTRVGIGIKQDSAGDLWLTIHMIERSITFTQFTLSQSNTTPAGHSITIKGNTTYKKIEVILVPPENSNPDLEVDRIIVPDPDGGFEINLTFGTASGNFQFEFYVEKDGVYKLTNFFSMGI